LSDDFVKEFQPNVKDAQIKEWVSKPKFGREGYGVLLSQNFNSYSEFVSTTEKSQSYDSKHPEILIGKPIYQKYSTLPHA
jgi:glutathionylspermidine synthase